jgi:2-polyprenyl-3-methyl-5-hydroxy-6-metoxy-1,4-benzoquinol methylase
LICLLILSLYYRIPKKIIQKIIEPRYSKSSFLKRINHKGKLLDVGCGNNSPYHIKKEYPDIIYTGIDVGDYNQTKPNLADNYTIVKPESFAEAIENMPELFDTVISSHNLEHCNDRDKTFDAMIKVLKPGGYLFISFPTEKSVGFPPRRGSLNYYDDKSHKDKPPNYDKIIATLKKNNVQIIFAHKSYKPFFFYLLGFLQEWKSKKDKEVKRWTWAYWGFETIIWARK